MSKEIMREIINNKFQSQFTAKQLAEEYLCQKHGISLSQVWHGDYANEKASLSSRISNLLHVMKQENRIQKISKRYWMVIKDE